MFNAWNVFWATVAQTLGLVTKGVNTLDSLVSVAEANADLMHKRSVVLNRAELQELDDFLSKPASDDKTEDKPVLTSVTTEDDTEGKEAA